MGLSRRAWHYAEVLAVVLAAEVSDHAAFAARWNDLTGPGCGYLESRLG